VGTERQRLHAARRGLPALEPLAGRRLPQEDRTVLPRCREELEVRGGSGSDKAVLASVHTTDFLARGRVPQAQGTSETAPVSAGESLCRVRGNGDEGVALVCRLGLAAIERRGELAHHFSRAHPPQGDSATDVDGGQ